MICPNCDHDGPRVLMRRALLPQREFPFVEFPRLCRRCRRELRVGPGNRVLMALLGLALLAAVTAAGLGVVCLLQHTLP